VSVKEVKLMSKPILGGLYTTYERAA